MREDRDSRGQGLNIELFSRKIPYALELVGNIFEVPFDHLERVGLRFSALAEHFLASEGNFEQFKFALSEASKLSSKRNIFIPPDFRDAFSAALSKFESEIKGEAGLAEKVESVKFAFALCDRDHPNSLVIKGLRRARSLSEVNELLPEDCNSLSEVNAALSKALKIVTKLNRPCTDALLDKLTFVLEDIEYSRGVPLALFRRFFALCDSSDSKASQNSMLFWATGPRDDVGLVAAESVAKLCNTLALKPSGGTMGDGHPIYLVVGILRQANPDQWIKEDYDGAVENLCMRLHKVDPNLYDSETIKALYKDLNIEGDGGLGVLTR